jgi:hypothetical protein
MDVFLRTVFTGTVLGALIAGSFKIVTDLLARRRVEHALIHGFSAEISAGLACLPEGRPEEVYSDEEMRFLASDGLPYEFYSSNKWQIGLIGSKAESVIGYYSVRWQFYRSGEIFAQAHEKAGEEPKKSADVDAAKNRMRHLLTATRESATSAVKKLRIS